VTESHQDSDDVVGFAATARQGERVGSSGGVVGGQRREDDTKPWRRHRQSADNVCTVWRNVAVTYCHTASWPSDTAAIRRTDVGTTTRQIHVV